MSLYKHDNIWWISVLHKGQRVQKSSGTSNKTQAKQLHDKLKAELWDQEHLKKKPLYLWEEAALRWINESQHKRSLAMDQCHLRWLDTHCQGTTLESLTRDRIDRIAHIKEKEGASPATINRMLAVVRAILRKAVKEWDWLDRGPTIRMRKEQNRRVRWLTLAEASKLLQHLPSHLAAMAEFSLLTGLRQSNVTQLEWGDIDLERKHAFIHPDKAKAKKAIPVPLNVDALKALQKQKGKHPRYVFVYRGNPITQCSTKAWYNALKAAGIENFRWHDLRHTWASWHIQNGTSTQELQQLGGWASYEMVLRYAHLSSSHLKVAAERVATILLHQPFQQTAECAGNP